MNPVFKKHLENCNWTGLYRKTILKIPLKSLKLTNDPGTTSSKVILQPRNIYMPQRRHSCKEISRDTSVSPYKALNKK